MALEVEHARTVIERGAVSGGPRVSGWLVQRLTQLSSDRLLMEMSPPVPAPTTRHLWAFSIRGLQDGDSEVGQRHNEPVSEQGGDAVVVWRVHPSRMVWAGVLWTLVMLSVVGAWLAWLVGPTEVRAVRAAVAAGIIAAVSLIWWLVLLRPRVELRDEVVVIVNPLATYRLHREDIVAVTDGLHGAEFHRRDGFKIHAVALGDASAGIRRGRLAEVQKALALADRRT